ncbi:hypothetical protein ASPSYDRAFT_58460 [Aspergillus sydowii CBS 593.65]|uniref:MT-A70-domain-containing protein n=1 Tax=Aspergillus sydowii CBS 593.65 TaxID=1036612 RepID=A0A1L9TEM3_9EURO|nr:uncharacterized protein ASPSYDRAFT_58460 [Aspergillus sydowii CBS 593.65]OJJ57872.1 hypothetical protein ASPSYDRAFT_58460 [Aspergillus sydowii CBS 593.65]
MTPKSAILYQNASSTVFLIDIPTSIALAQELSLASQPNVPCDIISFNSTEPPKKNLRRILSTPALKTPYAASFEPKSEAARTKVLARMPHCEIHEELSSLLSNALEDIRSNYCQDSEWCLSRCLLEDDESKELGSAINVEHQFQPPLILSPGRNRFQDEAELCNNLVKNTSPETATVEIRSLFVVKQLKGLEVDAEKLERIQVFFIPPLSEFILCNLPISTPLTDTEYDNANPIPSLAPDQKFNLIVMDPPWSNKSVRRSGHYETRTYLDSDLLMAYICAVLAVHSYSPLPNDDLTLGNKSNLSIAAIWITNSAKAREAAYGGLAGAGFSVCEEWIWVKTAVDGQPVTPIEGVWRKPYEILVIGKRKPGFIAGVGGDGILRRVIAAVPDVHSRKPNLKEAFEKTFFTSEPDTAPVHYSALEVFARNLTAGWWACGNEVLRFNSKNWWSDE